MLNDIFDFLSYHATVATELRPINPKEAGK